MLPHGTLDALLSSVSPRAVALLLAILRRFNGFNNGRIAFSRRDLGEAIGSTCTAASSRAIAELEQGGFIWQSHFPKGQRRASEFGLTFITSGPAGEIRASHLYLEVEKSRRWKNDTRGASPVPESDTRRKRGVSEDDTGATETSGLAVMGPVSETAAHIVNHPPSHPDPMENPTEYRSKIPAAGPSTSGMDLIELRNFCRAYLAQAPAGSQSSLAADIGLPAGTLSKFLAGRSVPAAYRMPLQLAVARAFPVSARGDWRSGEHAQRNDRVPPPPISEEALCNGATAADLGIDLRAPLVARPAPMARSVEAPSGSELAHRLPASFGELPIGDKIEHLDRAYKSIGRDPKALTSMDMMTFGRELYTIAEAHKDSALGQRAQRLFEEMKRE